MSQKIIEARQALAEARENLKVVNKNITIEDSFKLLAGGVDTVELLTKKQAQDEALERVIKAQKELIDAHL
jgi:hypothetical protein